MYFLINDQSGITQYRKTHGNIGRAFHPTECVNREEVGAMFESGCRKAAFDSVGWEFLYKVMEKFGFHKTFTHNTASLHVRLCIFFYFFFCFSCVCGYRLVTCFILLLLCHFVFYLFFLFLFKKKPHLDLFIIITTYK